jgi:hypothetical protein
MDWQGVEWVIPVFEIVMLVLPVYAFIVLYKKTRKGVLNKAGALWRYAVWLISPVIVYAVLFFGLVGIEEAFDLSVISEGLARSFLILASIGIVIWLVTTLIFAATVCFIKR